jgi:uncharacterized membrane protein YeiH
MPPGLLGRHNLATPAAQLRPQAGAHHPSWSRVGPPVARHSGGDRSRRCWITSFSAPVRRRSRARHAPMAQAGRLRCLPMDVPEGFSPALILVLNLAGTFVFGLSGGLAAVRAKLDLFGVVVLAAVVGLAGGITRDVLIGTPPATFRDWRYLGAAAAAGVVCFFAGRMLERAERSVMIFDALGLGLFAVTGATKALQFGLGPVQAILLGTITGVGGGMLRDVLLRQVPTVLREGLYAIPALLGATVLVVAQQAGSTNPVFPVLGVLVCVVVRLFGLRYGVNVPTPPNGLHDGSP